ncbi:MAG: hypothetical protein KAR06_11960 [Deltaproteobacteria bacterium]|nr:hypothetical protein [Deltaproteobacteria bacterium]
MSVFKKNKYYKYIFVLLATFALMSCGFGPNGDIGGGGNCVGSGNTGICLAIDSISPQNISGGYSDAVDMYQSTCLEGEEYTPEPFGASDAEIVISATVVDGVDPDVVSSKITLTGYTWTFALTGGTGPYFQLQTLPVPFTIAQNGTYTFSAAMVTNQMKNTFGYDEWFNNIYTFGYDYYPMYVVEYTFYGVDDNFNEVSATRSTYVTLGAFDNCP